MTISTRNMIALMPMTVQRMRLYRGFRPSNTGTPVGQLRPLPCRKWRSGPPPWREPVQEIAPGAVQKQVSLDEPQQASAMMSPSLQFEGSVQTFSG